MQQYLDLLESINALGFDKGDRTGTGTCSYPGLVSRYSLRDMTVLAPTTKKHHFQTGLVEEEWMMSGDTDVGFLKANGCNIWDEWVDRDKATFKSRDLKSMDREYKRNHFGWGKITIEASLPAEAFLVADLPEFTVGVLDDGLMQRHVVVRKLVDGVLSEDWYNPHHPIWIEFYRALGISDQEIVSGPLGAVYGKMFRDIEDTRLVNGDSVELEGYIKRGFELVGYLDHAYRNRGTKHCVVTRRIDQVDMLLKQFASGDYDSRRLILCPWNPAYLDEQALPPCHSFIQFWTRELSTRERLDVYLKRMEQWQEDKMSDLAKDPEGLAPIHSDVIVLDESLYMTDGVIDDDQLKAYMDELNVPVRALTCILYQRSADAFIGVPYNLSFYSILTHKLANQFNMWGEELVHILGDGHIYNNHQDQVAELLTREPLTPARVRFHKRIGTPLLEMGWKDVEIVGYESHAAIVAPIAV
jgi:thymidylate synthase